MDLKIIVNEKQKAFVSFVNRSSDFFYLVANMVKYSLMRAYKGGENEIVINNECMMIN